MSVTIDHILMSETRPLRITLETADGRILTGQAMVATFSTHSDYDPVHPWMGDYATYTFGKSHWEMTLAGIGPAKLQVGGDFSQEVKRARVANEWRCDYCGSIWERAVRKCVSCGASRSVLYE